MPSSICFPLQAQAMQMGNGSVVIFLADGQ